MAFQMAGFSEQDFRNLEIEVDLSHEQTYN